MFVAGHLHGGSRTFRGGRALALVLVLLAIFMAAAFGLFAAPAQAAEVEYSSEEIAFITMLNDYRVANGAPALLISDALSLAAQKHSSDMGENGYFSHTSQTSDYFWPGALPWDRMRASGYDYNTAMGENIAAGQASAAQVLASWQGSSGHNALMLSTDYRVVGIGFEYIPGSPYSWYWTLDFGGYVDPTAHDTGYYQQSDGRINYLGVWGNAGTFYWADDEGAGALISFQGGSIELYAQLAPGYGMAEVSVDGGPAQVVDFYHTGTASKQLVYTKTGLNENATHTLTIRCIHEKNPASYGYAIDLDAIRVMKSGSTPGSLVQAPTADRYQQDDGRIAYTGGWVEAWTWWQASECTYMYVNSPGASANVTFDGTYLSWVGKKGPNYGKAQVSLDGGEPVTVDLYSPYSLYKQKIYDTGLLEDGVHTLSIYWSGTKSYSSSDCNISADTFDVFGELLTADPAAPLAWSYEQSDPRITYVGSWATRWDGRASAWSFFYSVSDGAGALVNFDGEGIELVAKKGPCYGLMELTLLNQYSAVVDTEIVDLYAPQDVFGQTVYTNTGLADGAYTLVVKATGEMNPLAMYPLINIDGLFIDGYLTQGPTLDRYQQDTPAFSYTGPSWATGWSWSASGYSFNSVDAPGAKVTIQFEGSYLSLVARTTPWYGRAKVTLDGDYAHSAIVDLYSSSVGWKVPVYSTGLITPGVHTVEVEWTGQKSGSSWGTAISVDAVDILGSGG